jgi:hypothetical protein
MARSAAVITLAQLDGGSSAQQIATYVQGCVKVSAATRLGSAVRAPPLPPG